MPSSSSSPLRLGIIGAGLAARVLHWPALKRLKTRFKITMIASGSEESASSFADLVGSKPPWTLDYHEVLANPEVDAVLIALPIPLTADALLDGARSGKHILCEKPVAGNLDAARQVVADVEAITRNTDQIIVIGEHIRYRADIIQAREWIDEGRIGDLYLVDASTYFYTDTSHGFASTPWRQNSQYRGGPVTDGGLHHAAFLREIGGDIEQLQAFTRTIHPEFTGTDTITLNMRFRSGALGHYLYAGGAVGVKTPFVNATIFGTQGSIVLDDKTARLYTRQGEIERRGPYKYLDAYYNQLINFHEAITRSAPVVSTPAQSLSDLELLMRAYDSSEGSGLVVLP